MKLLILCVVSLAVSSVVQSQFTERRQSIGNCPRPSSDVIADLISQSFDGTSLSVVTVHDIMVVCESPGLIRDTISSFSVVVSYSCSGGVSGCDGTARTEQFQYECNSDNTFTQAEISAGSVRTANPTGTLATPLNEQCAQCSDISPEADHCVPCAQSCTEGQMRCVGPDTINQCCNWYSADGRCVVTCPGNLVGDTEPETVYDCGCGRLQLEFGTISYSNRFAVDSVATHTCNRTSGYVLSGSGNQRTCDLGTEGWTGNPITCTLFDCEGPEVPENGDVSITATTFGSVVMYSCDEGFMLVGNEERVCEIQGWTGSIPTCDSVVTTDSSSTVDATDTSTTERNSSSSHHTLTKLAIALIAGVTAACFANLK